MPARAPAQNRPGSRAYEFQDARQYAALGCRLSEIRLVQSRHARLGESSYSTMRDALAKAGRPILFSICEWGSTKPWLWAGEVGNLWRTTGDIIDKWEGHEKWGGNGVVQILDLQNGNRKLRRSRPLERSRHARSGQWRDDRNRISLALQPVVFNGGAAHGWKRYSLHER